MKIRRKDIHSIVRGDVEPHVRYGQGWQYWDISEAATMTFSHEHWEPETIPCFGIG